MNCSPVFKLATNASDNILTGLHNLCKLPFAAHAAMWNIVYQLVAAGNIYTRYNDGMPS